MRDLPPEALNRIERADTVGLCRMAQFVAGLFPEIPVRIGRPAGACLLVMGVGQVVNKVTGLGHDGPVKAATLAAIEQVFKDAGVTAQVEVWPHADPSLQVLLEVRGYRRAGGWHVLVAELDAGLPVAAPGSVPDLTLEPAGPVNAELYEQTVARGFMDMDEADPGLPERVFARAAARHPETTALLARLNGRPAGGGAMSTHQGTASLFGASTLPAFRGRGVQRALLARRLEIARESGCDLALIKTSPDSGSERNARRAGFEVAARTVYWRKD